MFRKSTLAVATLLALGAGSAFADDSPVSVTAAEAPATTTEAPAPAPAPTPAPVAQGKGQASMQSVLGDLIQGKTDLAQIQPMARVNLLQQPGMLASLSMRLQSFGALQSMTFAGMQNGREIYDVRFANASMLFAAAITPDGKISAINWKFH